MNRKDLVKTLFLLDTFILYNDNGYVDLTKSHKFVNRRTKRYKLLREVFEEFSEIRIRKNRLEVDWLFINVYSKFPIDTLLYSQLHELRFYKELLNEKNLYHFRRFELHRHSFFMFYLNLRTFVKCSLKNNLCYNYTHSFSLPDHTYLFSFLRHEGMPPMWIQDNKERLIKELNKDTKKFIENVVECMKGKGLISG